MTGLRFRQLLDIDAMNARRRIHLLSAVLIVATLSACSDDEPSADSTTSSTSTTTTSEPGSADVDENPGKPAFEGTFDEITAQIDSALSTETDRCELAQLVNALAEIPPPTTEEQTRTVIKIISKSFLAMEGLIDPAATTERDLLTTAADAILEAGKNWKYDPETFATNIGPFNQELIPAYRKFNPVLDECVLGTNGETDPTSTVVPAEA